MHKVQIREQGRPWWRWAIFCLGLGVLGWGCQSPQPPLSPAAAAFKNEVKEIFARVSPPLVEALTKGDRGAMQAVLENYASQARAAGRPWPFVMALLSQNGIVLATYPERKGGKDFSNYDTMTKIVKKRRIAQQVFYWQDGSRLYVIGEPLLEGAKVMGVLALGLNGSEAQQQWGLTEAEFLALDFNR